MAYQTVFSKTYSRSRNKQRKCEDRGRLLDRCPANKIVKTLFRPVYGSDIFISACESSMTLASRPDPYFAVLNQRATRQLYLFEKSGILGDSESLIGALDIRCPSIKEMDELGESPRWGQVMYCASCYLRPPRYMTDELGYSIPLLDFYSTHSGLLPFACTPYMSHHSFFGYVCAQAAIYLCLEMMMPFGANPHSPATLSHIVSLIRTDEDYPKQKNSAFCDEHHEADIEDLSGYQCRGLFAPEIRSLLDHSDLNTRGLLFDAALAGNDTDKAVMMHLKAMLGSRIPIIAQVDFNTLTSFFGNRIYLQSSEAHVITIIGYSVTQNGHNIIFHDGHLGPYRELSISNFIKAARKTCNYYDYDENAVLMFSPLPSEVNPYTYIKVLYFSLALSRKNYNCDIRLTSLRQLFSQLIKYSQGKPMLISEQLKILFASRVSETHPLWLLEYVDKKSNEISIDILDASKNNNNLRLGTLNIGDMHSNNVWKVLLAKGEQRSIEHAFLRENDVDEKNKIKIPRV